MMTQYESEVRDQRSRLSFLFKDLRRVISDIRHLRKAATFGRLCSSSDTGSRMYRLHTNLINTMNEKVWSKMLNNCRCNPRGPTKILCSAKANNVDSIKCLKDVQECVQRLAGMMSLVAIFIRRQKTMVNSIEPLPQSIRCSFKNILLGERKYKSLSEYIHSSAFRFSTTSFITGGKTWKSNSSLEHHGGRCPFSVSRRLRPQATVPAGHHPNYHHHHNIVYHSNFHHHSLCSVNNSRVRLPELLFRRRQGKG